jgi:hypothetical protein
MKNIYKIVIVFNSTIWSAIFVEHFSEKSVERKKGEKVKIFRRENYYAKKTFSSSQKLNNM